MSCVNFGDGNSGNQVGINQGVINISAERVESLPEPQSTVPFPHDPDSVCRDALLDQIHEKASIPGSRVALVGLGGVGKTQLAIEYARQVRLQSAETWVFWIHASNTARCEKSLRDLADRVKIPGRQVRNTNIFQLVGNWLQDAKIGKWILILDNIDDDELLRSPLATSTESQTNMQSNDSAQPPIRYLLQSAGGSIIITSRNKRVALDITGYKNLIEVQPLNQAEALDLLQKKLNIPTEHESLAQLAQELEFMPLAIVQAAGYISHRSPRCSVLQYLEKLRKNDHEAVRVLNEEAGLLYRDWEAKNSILVTWQISFDYISEKRPSATDLLSLMSFFDRQGITETILRVQQNQQRSESPHLSPLDDSLSDTDNESTEDADANFEQDIQILRDFSLIVVRDDNISFTMHRLVQLTVRTWLKTHCQLEQWKGRFIKNLLSEFPSGMYRNWEKSQSLFPHVKGALFQQPESPVSILQWAELLCRGAWYAQSSGLIIESRQMALKSRKCRLEICGEESAEALSSTTILAQTYYLEGRLEKAEHLQVAVMEMSMTKLGADHPVTLESTAGLALTYWNQGRWEEAEQLQVPVMEISKTKLGAHHPVTLVYIANLASTYSSQGRWEEAKQLQAQVIEMSKTERGTDHPDTLVNMGNLASTYLSQGRWKEAEQLQVPVMDMSKTKLGADHPFTLISMTNLAGTYSNQGRWEEAEQLQVSVMDMSKTKLGADHPSTLISISNLAWTYLNQGRWEEAEKLEVQLMEINKTKLGADHPDTLRNMSHLASVYWDQNRWEEAEQLGVQLMEINKTKLGADHPDTLESMANLAFTLKSAGRLPEAIDLLRACLTKQKRILGATHPDTVSNADSLLAWETEELAITV